MAEYHVGASWLTNAIYAGTLNKKGDKWVNRSDVTEEALAVVRDHLEQIAQDKEKSFFRYEWTKKNGTVVQLAVKIKPSKEEQNDG